MKLGLTLFTPKLWNQNSGNAEKALELATAASEAGAEFILTPEEATYDRAKVKAYWQLHEAGKNPIVVSTEDQLASFLKLAKKYNNVIGVGFVEFSEAGLFNSYAIVTPEEISIRRKTIDGPDQELYFYNREKKQLYEKSLKRNGKAIQLALNDETLKVATLICREAGKNKKEVFQSLTPADLVVVPGYALPYQHCNELHFKALVKERVLKPTGTVVYCDAKEPFAKAYAGGSQIFFATKPGVHLVDIPANR